MNILINNINGQTSFIRRGRIRDFRRGENLFYFRKYGIKRRIVER